MTTGPGESRVHPTRDDGVVATLSESVGGPVGDRAGRHPWWTPVRVVLALTAVCFVIGMVQKSSCYEASWRDGEERYTHMCYSDLPYLYTGRGLAERSWPYSSDEQTRARYDVMEYPVVISYYAWGAAWVTQAVGGFPDLEARFTMPAGRLAGTDTVVAESRLFVVVNAIGLAVAALLAAYLLARVNPRRPWDAAIFALSPALALTALVNWDLLAVACVAGALWAWARDRPVLTGVLIGVGTATKLYPLFLLGAILVLCMRGRRLRDFGATVLAGAGAWAVVNLPAWLTGRAQWEVFWSFNADRSADLGSLWLLAAQASDAAISAATVNQVSLLVFAAWCVGVLVLGLRAPVTPRFAQLGFLVVAGFLLVNKVYSPQYVLWLLPLAVLARPRWRDQLVWQSGEILYFACVWWYLGGQLDAAGAQDAGFYWVAILLRVAAELYLCAVVARDVMRPDHDPVDREDWTREPWWTAPRALS